MQWLLLHSPKQNGNDGLYRQIAKRLPGSVDIFAADAGGLEGPEVAYDAILVLDSLNWFMQNRLSIPGRPWVCAASFCFEDLKHLIELNSKASSKKDPSPAVWYMVRKKPLQTAENIRRKLD